jgi:hypothetical protein
MSKLLLGLVLLIVAIAINASADALLRQRIAEAKQKGCYGTATRLYAGWLGGLGWLIWLGLAVGAMQILQELAR